MERVVPNALAVSTLPWGQRDPPFSLPDSKLFFLLFRFRTFRDQRVPHFLIYKFLRSAVAIL